MELYNTQLLDEVGYKLTKKEEISTTPSYEQVDIKQIMAPAVEEKKEDTRVHLQGNATTKKVEQDMTIDEVNLETLNDMLIEDVRLIYKRVTGK